MIKKLKLTIELVPASTWDNNLRNLLKSQMWEYIRKSVYKKCNYKCVICKNKTGLHAHEIWKYDDKNHIQKLVNIFALCSKCHSIKHLGFAGLQISKGKVNYENLVKHFMQVNNCSREIFEKHQKKALKKFEERSHFDWQIDLSEYQKAQD
ncbi:HNH endonuclease [Candidatus Woesebacteria bacterium RBG_13_34_9]|uniref:HNH endonuclease n=1 Tax=Candidatus Woesebacteria bacterium RBG_13_34_9 TaxID=1802477 RepID=A0A1F7X437_9BACT|nr:MAG: HNH endonuclease [Candidatus Woesebacteria bacterium RBG_13_34_9]